MVFSVEKYVEEVRCNLEKKSKKLIEFFRGLENAKFPKEAAVLVAWSSFSLDDVSLFLEANEDMFDSVHPIEGSEYTFSVTLLANLVLYDEDSKKFNEDEEKKFNKFYSDHDLEAATIKEYGKWVKKCFDQAKIIFNEPIYFMILDEEDALNLVTGEWEDQMEIKL